MLKIITILALTICVKGFALEDSPESRSREAERYMAATPPKELFADMAEQVAKTLPPQSRAVFKKAFTQHLDLGALTKAMKDAMIKNFTTDELAALADFYGSPVGKSAMKKFGTYMAGLMPVVQGEMLKVMAKVNRELPDQPTPK